MTGEEKSKLGKIIAEEIAEYYSDLSCLSFHLEAGLVEDAR